MSIPRHWTPHNVEPEPFIPPLSMLQPGSAAGGGSSHSHRRHSSTPVSISRVPSSQAIVDMNMNMNRQRPSPIPMHPHPHPHPPSSFRPSNAPPQSGRSHFPPNAIPIPMPNRPRTITPGHPSTPREEADYPQSFPPRYVPFNGDTPGQPGLGLFEQVQPPTPSPTHEHPKREHAHQRGREFDRERSHSREHVAEREDVVMLGTSIEESNPLTSGEADAILKAQRDRADQLWEEEQERLRKEVEEEKRKYEEEKSLGLPHHSPASPVVAPNSVFQSRSRSHSHTQLSISHSNSDRYIAAPPPQSTNEEMATPPQTVPSPPSQSATRYVSTKDDRERWRREIRQVIEEQVRRQSTAKEEAERAMREAQVAAEAELRRKERERREAEQRRQQEQQEQEQEQEQEQPEEEEEEDQEEDMESVSVSMEDNKRKRRASSVRTKSKTKSVISSSTRVEGQKRREQKDSRRWARRREDERRHSRYYRRSQRIGGRRFANQSDAWSRSGVGGPFRPRARSIAARSRPQSQIGLDAGIDAFGFGVYDSEAGETEEFKDTDVSEVFDEWQESDAEPERDVREAMESAWNLYESQWNTILKNPPHANTLRFVDIPWPTAESLPVPSSPSPLKSLPPSSVQISDILNERTISEFLLSPYHSKNKSNRIRIRSALLKYHPDRVMRWGNLVQESERMAVVMGAEIVVRCLNDIMERLSDDTNVGN